MNEHSVTEQANSSFKMVQLLLFDDIKSAQTLMYASGGVINPLSGFVF
jgi:hypothetical protein